MADNLIIGGQKLASRLFIGTGKFPSGEVMSAAIEASGAQVVTVALKRVDLNDREDPFLKRLFKNSRYIFMPNTSGARNAFEAVKIAELCRAALGTNWIKVEIHPEPRYLLPDPIETLQACEALVKKGFTVLPYINADPVLARRLEEVGCAAVMPLAAPIGSNKGLVVGSMLEIIIEQASVPVIIDAGLGKPSHAAQCMEMGAAAVLVNTAIAVAQDPVQMARAFALSVEAARIGYLAGLGPESNGEAVGTSPLTSFLDEMVQDPLVAVSGGQ